MSKQYVFIMWDCNERVNLRHEYIGGGEYKVVGDPIVATHRVLWSDDISQATIDAAKQYAKDDMQDDYRFNLRVVVDEWGET